MFCLGKVKPVPSLWGWGLDQRGHCQQRSCRRSQDGRSWDLGGGINLERDSGGGQSAGGEFSLPAELWGPGLAERARERRCPQQSGGQAWRPCKGRAKRGAYASHFHLG